LTSLPHRSRQAVEDRCRISAEQDLNPEIIRTPLQLWRHACSQTGMRAHPKLESLQRTGSFKARVNCCGT
jgi:threonine dehydratase